MSITTLLPPHVKDLGGGFLVRRLLPSPLRQSVGPFLFFDHFGPLEHTPGVNTDVRPHPHIGLATVTYLWDGAMMHRDSLGYTQRIEPGAINWMTAGRGIVHSERMPEDVRQMAHRRHGLQLWAALPKDAEEADPAFVHTPADAIPEVHADGVTARVLIGEAFGKRSPVATFSQTLYLDLAFSGGGSIILEPTVEERCVYSVDAPMAIDEVTVEPFHLAILEPGRPIKVSAPNAARVVVLGGEPLDGRRRIWWNFVSSDPERLELAKQRWKHQQMGTVPGETEFIPLPE